MTATITSQDQMEQALEQLGRLYQGLAALRLQVEAANPSNFAILAEGHIDEIRRLQHELDEYAGAVAAQENSAPLWLRVVGRDIEWQSAPTSVLVAILDVFRKGVQSVAELILTGNLTTRPTAALKRSTDFRVVALAPGSLRVSVRLPAEEGEAGRAVGRALAEYLRAAAWAGSGQPEDGNMPALYLSHGAPPVFNDAHWMDQLFSWSRSIPKPTAILIVSAHWETAPLALSSPAVGTRLVYDFSGFGRRYFSMTYPSPDASALAAEVTALMSDLEPVHEQGPCTSALVDRSRASDLDALVKRFLGCLKELFEKLAFDLQHFAWPRSRVPKDKGILIEIDLA